MGLPWKPAQEAKDAKSNTANPVPIKDGWKMNVGVTGENIMAKVFVALGVKQVEGGLMPATVTRLGRGNKPSYQYLSKEQHEAMGEDQTAIWEAEWVGTHWWLETRYPNGPLVAEAEKQWRETPVEFDPREIPF